MILVVASIAVIGIAVWYFMGWALAGAFRSSMESKEFEQLSSVLEASIGSTVARGDVQFRPGRPQSPQGAIPYYQAHPEELQRDRQYFQTWSSALAIARSSLENGHQLKNWESCTELTWIPPSQRADSWGHAFCIQSDQQRAIVVSAGPQAMGSLDCKTLKIPEDGLARMPHGRLTQHPSGALILVVKGSAQTPVTSQSR